MLGTLKATHFEGMKELHAVHEPQVGYTWALIWKSSYIILPV